MSLEPSEVAHARSGAYLLLADLFADGPRPELLEGAAASPILARALEGRGADGLDDLAADHQHVFGFCVPPLEGLFLDPDGSAGGLGAERVRETYASVGYRPDPTKEEPEHLATQLRALALLSGAEADALANDEPEMAAALRGQQRHLLDAHLLRWFPVLAAAVRRIGPAFPSALVTQLEELLRHHLAGFDGEGAPRWTLAEPLDLDDPSVSLRDIARYLTTPGRAGVFLGRHDIAQLGRAFRLPRGFGGRARMMHQLLTAAARFDALGELADALGELIEASDAALAPWGAAVAPWRTRAQQTRGVVARLGEAAIAEDEREAEGGAE